MNKKNEFYQVDQLVDYLKRYMPKTAVLVKNKGRYEEIMQAIEEISSFAWAISPDASISVAPDELTGSFMTMDIVTDLIVIDQIDKFCAAIKKANNFEVCARTDGKLSFSVVFHDAFVPAPPRN